MAQLTPRPGVQILAWVVVLPWLVASPARSQDQVLARFRSEAPGAWQRINDADESAGSVRLTIRESTHIAGKLASEERSGILERKPGHYLWRRSREDSELAVGGNPAYSFVIVKKAGDSSWIMNDTINMKNGTSKALMADFVNYFRPNGSAFILDKGTVADLIRDDRCRIIKAEMKQNLVRVSFELLAEGPSKSKFTFTGWMDFNPANCWAMERMEYTSNAGTSFKLGKTFAAEGDPYRPCTAWETIDENPKQKFQRKASTTYEVVDSDNRRDATFYLSAFGLPEPHGVTVPTSRWYLWFCGLAVLSLGVGWYFLRRARLRKNVVDVAPAPPLMEGRRD